MRQWIAAALCVAVLSGIAATAAEGRDRCKTQACKQRVWDRQHPFQSALASWYGPGFYGRLTACGRRLTPGAFGVAHRTYRCGTLLRFCHRGRCRTAPVIDHGPYIAGRTFDLSGPLRHALGCGPLCTLRWRPAAPRFRMSRPSAPVARIGER